MIGPDAVNSQPSAKTLKWIRKIDAENSAKAALVTGPRKIFNDAALAVEKISANVKAYWQINSARYDFEPVETGISDMISRKPELCGNKYITADIEALETLMEGLPSEDQELCKTVITKTRDHIRTEKEICALERNVDSLRSPYRRDVGLAILNISFGLGAIFRIAGARGEFHDSLEIARRQLESKALAPV